MLTLVESTSRGDDPDILRIEVPRAFAPLLQQADYKGAYGGRGSAKSWSFAANVLRWCVTQPSGRIVCIREIQESLAQSVKRLLEDLIVRFGLSSMFDVFNTHIEHERGIIIFNGMQNHTAESIKSLEGFDVAWVEEAQSLSQRSLDLLRPTIRKTGSELWFTWNPQQASDPVDAFFRGPQGPPPRAVIVRVSYQDNPWLSEKLQREINIDRSRDPDKFAHVWLGEYERHSEARVFKNWTVDAFETPANTTFYFGADWGFSVDPTVLVRCWLRGRMLYIDREVYQVGCEINDIPALFDSMEHRMAREWTIVADSARPETISYLRHKGGYNRILPAIKGPNSVKEGIIFLQGYDIVIHPRCPHTIEEFTMYCYQTDPMTGFVTPILEDKKNHVIDSVRYAVEPLRALVKGFQAEVW